MGILNLQVGNNEEQAEPQTVTPENTPATTATQEVNTVDSESTELVPVEDNVKSEENKEAKTIVLDGPLSQIYTQALNLVYAKEDMAAFMVDNSKQVTPAKKQDLFVYCADGDLLDSQGMVEATNTIVAALESHNYGKVMTLIRYKNKVNSKMGLLQEFGNSLGVKVMLSNKTPAESVKIAVESIPSGN